METIKSTKYCRTCGARLRQPDDLGNLNDGAYWRFNYSCLLCRLTKLFGRFV